MFRTAPRAASTSLLVVVALSLNTAAAAQGNDKDLYDLNSKTPKGTTVWFIESATTEQTSSAGQIEVATTVHIERTFRITVKQVDSKGNRIVEMQVARIAGWAQVGEHKKRTFDSENGDQNMGGYVLWVPRMVTSVDRRYIARIDSNGKFVGSMAAVARAILNEDPKANIKGWVLADLAETAFGRTLVKPTAIGGTWNFRRSGTGMMRVTRNCTMQLTNVSDSAFAMLLTGSIEKGAPQVAPVREDDMSPEAQVARMNMEVNISNGKLTGTQSLSRRDGLVIEAETESTFDASLGTVGQDPTSQVVIKTRLRRIDKPILKPRKQKLAEAKARQALAELTARTRKSQSVVKMIADAVRMYYAKNSKLPASLQDLAKKDNQGRSEILELPTDPWGNAYKLLPGDTPRDFQVISAGPDGKYESDDDINSRNK